jgi:membrane-bound inhibitor of C-type lysozyme
MNHTYRTGAVCAVALCTLLAGCSSMPSVWPFGSSGNAARPRVPANATAYECDNGRKLYVRYIDNGKAAWVILPDREFRLDPVISASGARFSNGVASLETKGNEASLRDGPTLTHANCRTGGATG